MKHLFNPLYRKTDNELAVDIGSQIKRLRVLKNITQEELARHSGISRQQMGKIENDGKTSLLTLIAVARKLDRLDELYKAFGLVDLLPSEELELLEIEEKIKSKRKKYARQK